MFLPSMWGLLKSWRNKASSCLNVWARPEILFRIYKVMTLRVSVDSNTSISVLSMNICVSKYMKGSHSPITCTYTYIQSFGNGLNSEPPSPLLFNLLRSFPAFFPICLFLHLSSLSRKQPCCDSRYVVQCSEIIHTSPPPASPPGKAVVSRDSKVMCPVRHLHTMVTSLPQGLWILSLVIYIAVFIQL